MKKAPVFSYKQHVKVYGPADVAEEMVFALLNGRDKGTTTYIPELDEAWTWRGGEVNLWTGYANEGKGTFIRYISLIKALEEDKKFVFYVPEDGPAASFFDELIHTASGKSTDKDNDNFIGQDLYDFWLQRIKDLFVFIYIKAPYNTIENIIETWEELLEEDPELYGFVIDPYVRVTRSDSAPERDDLYAGYLMNFLTDFAEDHKHVTVHMVMHQLTPKVDANGYYPKPNMYTIKNGGTFADTTDNVLSVWRPKYAKEKIDTSVVFSSEKIKKQKLVGVPKALDYKFDRKKNRFMDANNPLIDLYPFEKWIPKKAS